MKIGFDAKRLFHNNTGLGNYSRTLVRNIVEKYPEHDYHLFTPSIAKNDATAYFLNNDRFTIHTASGGLKAYWRTMKIPALLDKHQIDIYHGLSHELPFRKPKSDCKYVVSFHDLIYEIYPGLFPVFDRFMYKIKYRKSARVADRIISISTSTTQDLEQIYSIPKNKMSVVFQSCNPRFLSNKTIVSRRDRGYFAYVGSVIPRKGLMKIAEAYLLLDKAKRKPIKVIGGGGAYLEEVKQFVRDNGIDSHFEFLGKVDNDDLLTYYQNALALILPSVYEGFGIPVIEALSQYTPVITSNISSLPEAAGPGGVLVDPRKAEAIAEAMRFVVDSPRVSEEMANLGHDYVHENFNAEKTTDDLMGVYQHLYKEKD